MEKDVYNGKFLNDEKLEEVVRDILVVLEKWQLRQLEKQIALAQAEKFLRDMQNNKIAQSREADLKGFVGKWMNKLGVGDENEQV